MLLRRRSATANSDAVVQASAADGIAVIRFNNPPMNTLAHTLRSGVLGELQRAIADATVKAIVLIGGGRAFCSGAEIKLGILPGAGGTQRLPRALGVERALPLIMRGDVVKSEQVSGTLLIDALIEGDLLQGALTFTHRLLQDKAPAPCDMPSSANARWHACRICRPICRRISPRPPSSMSR